MKFVDDDDDDDVAAACAWILADRRGDGQRAAGFFEVHGPWYCKYWPPNNSSCGDSPQLLLFGGRMAGGQSHGSNI